MGCTFRKKKPCMSIKLSLLCRKKSTLLLRREWKLHSESFERKGKKEQDTLTLRPPEAGLNKQRDKWPFETWLYTEFQNQLGNGYWPNHLPTTLKQSFNFCIILQNYNSSWINKCQLKSSWKWIHWMGNQEICHRFLSKHPCLIVYCNFHNIFIGNSKPPSIWNCNIWPPFHKLDFAVRDIIDFTIVDIKYHYFHTYSLQKIASH